MPVIQRPGREKGHPVVKKSAKDVGKPYPCMMCSRWFTTTLDRARHKCAHRCSACGKRLSAFYDTTFELCEECWNRRRLEYNALREREGAQG